MRYMQKTKLCSEIKNLLGIVASYKILSYWSPENFVKIAVKPLFHGIYAKNEIMLRNQKHFGNCCFSYNTFTLVTRKFRQNRRKTIISRDICKKPNYAQKSKTFCGIVASYKTLSHWSPENFVKIAEKPLFHEIYAKNQIILRNQKPFGNCCFSYNTFTLVTRKFRQNRRKTIISRDICEKRNYGPKSKTIWELLLLIKYLPLW